MERTQDSVQNSKLPVRFTKDHTCHTVRTLAFGFVSEDKWKQDEKPLGSGSFGVVWLQQCTNKVPGRLRAVKEISKGLLRSAHVDYRRELDALSIFSQAQHSRYFVRSLGWYESSSSIFIAMEYLKFGDLQRYLGKPLPENEARTIAFQVLEGLRVMHKDGFAHRDLKPANIFVVSTGPDWLVKIGDFGLSKRVDQTLTAFRSTFGTYYYLAPEVLMSEGRGSEDNKGQNYTFPVDIWALGVIIFRMVAGVLPFSDIAHLVTHIKTPSRAIFEPLHTMGVNEDCQNLVESFLCVVPTDRLTAKSALSHPWRSTSLVPGDPSSNGDPDQPSARSGLPEASGKWTALDASETQLETSFSDLVIDIEEESSAGTTPMSRSDKAIIPGKRSSNIRKRSSGNSRMSPASKRTVDRYTFSPSDDEILIVEEESSSDERFPTRKPQATHRLKDDELESGPPATRTLVSDTGSHGSRRRRSHSGSVYKRERRKVPGEQPKSPGQNGERGIFTRRWAMALDESRRRHDEKIKNEERRQRRTRENSGKSLQRGESRMVVEESVEIGGPTHPWSRKQNSDRSFPDSMRNLQGP